LLVRREFFLRSAEGVDARRVLVVLQRVFRKVRASPLGEALGKQGLYAVQVVERARRLNQRRVFLRERFAHAAPRFLEQFAARVAHSAEIVFQSEHPLKTSFKSATPLNSGAKPRGAARNRTNFIVNSA
jgi:hypothetical protein